MRRNQNQRGFTLMELMVVIVIVAILAAVAVPLYINYVKDAQRTEAKGAIGAIIAAEQVYFQKNGDFATGMTDVAQIEARLQVDLAESKQNWTFKVDPNTDGFIAKATGIAERPSKNLSVTYTHSRTSPPPTAWIDE